MKGNNLTMSESSVSWRKSSRSDTCNCVEVASIDGLVGLRDSKDPDGPILLFARVDWRQFVRAIREDGFKPS